MGRFHSETIFGNGGSPHLLGLGTRSEGNGRGVQEVEVERRANVQEQDQKDKETLGKKVKKGHERRGGENGRMDPPMVDTGGK